MNLYVVTSLESPEEWDVYLGYVCCAQSPEEARSLGRLLGDCWLMPNSEGKQVVLPKTKVELIGTTVIHKSPKILLDSFKAG
jgi:hypothetical protein